MKDAHERNTLYLKRVNLYKSAIPIITIYDIFILLQVFKKHP